MQTRSKNIFMSEACPFQNPLRYGAWALKVKRWKERTAHMQIRKRTEDDIYGGWES